jgi:hypothetical protein
MNDFEDFKLKLSNGQMAKPDEVNSSAIDSLTTIIPDVRSNSNEVKFDNINGLQKLNFLSFQINLCNAYQWVESTWQDCLWNGYEYIKDGSSGYYIQPASDAAHAVAISTAVTKYRRNMFQTNLVGLLSEIWRNQLSSKTKAQLTSTEIVTTIIRSGKSKKILLSSGKKNEVEDKAHFEAFVTKDLIQQEFYIDILSTRIEKLHGEPVSKLFDVWLVLRSLSRATAIRIDDASVRSPNALLSYASSYPRIEIAKLVMKATSLKISIVNTMLDFLTFRKRGDTLWSRPLIESKDGKILLPYAALHQAEPLYVLECWLPMLSINLGKKGNPFERQVRSSLKNTLKSPLISQIFSVFEHDLIFHPNHIDERNEEIDLIFLINKKLYIGEIKCSVVPIEGADFHNNRKILIGAAEQALRKSASVKRNIEKFRKQLRDRGFIVPMDIQIMAIVVSNNIINSGYAVNDVPVVDIPILERYLEGELIDLSFKAGLDPTNITHFYKSAEEAEERIDRYFRNPPQLRHFKPSVKMRELEIPANLFNENIPKLRIKGYEVNVNVEEVRGRLSCNPDPLTASTSD